jgi:hypothetical protein
MSAETNTKKTEPNRELEGGGEHIAPDGDRGEHVFTILEMCGYRQCSMEPALLPMRLIGQNVDTCGND